MSYRFYDITLYGADDKDFACRNNLISSLYIDFLDGYKPKSTTRISVSLGNENRVIDYTGSILLAEVEFDKEEYRLSSPESQNKIILDTIHRIAILCAEKYGWDKAIFERAYDRAQESKFIYRKELKKKLSKDKKYQAALLLEKNGKFATVSANFYNSNGDFLKSVELLKCFYHELFYGRLISNYKWFDGLKFGLHTKDNEIVINASIDKTEPEIIISPTTKTQEELEGYLRQITYQEFADEADIIKWANQ